MEVTDKIAKIAVNNFNVDKKRSHVSIKEDTACMEQCPVKDCVLLCPSGVFVPQEYSGELIKIEVHCERCVECGACYILCDNVVFDYPRGGYGISHKFG